VLPTRASPYAVGKVASVPGLALALVAQDGFEALCRASPLLLRALTHPAALQGDWLLR